MEKTDDEPTIAAPPLATPSGEPDAEANDEAVDRAEHRVDGLAQDLVDTAEVVEEDVEAAAARGFLGGPMMWGLLALLAVIVVLVILR